MKIPRGVTFASAVQHLVPELRSLQVLLVFCLISAYELGPGPISWFIAAELFDQPGRPIAMAFTSMLNWGGKFVLALLFPPLLVRFTPPAFTAEPDFWESPGGTEFLLLLVYLHLRDTAVKRGL